MLTTPKPTLPPVLYAAHDDALIWGTGPTPGQARADARQWLGDATPDIERYVAALLVCPMTPALAEAVEKGGGCVCFAHVTRDVIGTCAEADAVEELDTAWDVQFIAPSARGEPDTTKAVHLPSEDTEGGAL